MDGRTVRGARRENLEEILAIFEGARGRMAAQGNPTQWGDAYPGRELVEKDICAGVCYVLQSRGGRLEAVFSLIPGEDPCYRDIRGGAWKNDLPYCAIHRVASAGKSGGIADLCLSWCAARCGNLRADTHSDNAAMRHVLEKNGFARCGTVIADDGTPRVAYQKTGETIPGPGAAGPCPRGEELERKDRTVKTERYLVKEGQRVSLKSFPTACDTEADKKKVKRELMPENISAMAGLQEKLFAENRHALLIVLQAMDAAGKDGTIRHVMSGLNPQGTQVTSFKVPSSEENDHDYLWRISKALPRRGEIGIFNRSHYEDVIVARVHDLVSKSQIPPELVGESIWEERYAQIANFERYLSRNGIAVVKIYLHLSKEEQRRRLLDRIREKDKNWKFSPGDVAERKHWGEYMEAYEDMLEKTSSEEAPWYVVPADNKWYARYVVSCILREKLEQIDPKVPELAEDAKAALEECRTLLEKGD